VLGGGGRRPSGWSSDDKYLSFTHTLQHTGSHSGEDHQREDWLAIHQKICPIVSVLRSPLPHASSQEEREHHRHQQTLRKVRRRKCVCVCVWGGGGWFIAGRILSFFLSHSSPVSQTHIIELALQEGKRFLHEGEHALAIPAALEALKFLTELHGGTHIQLTPAYLILAEAAIGQSTHTLISFVSTLTHTPTHPQGWVA